MSARVPAPLPLAEPSSPPKEARSPYIAGRLYDWAFFLLPPLLSLVLGALLAGTSFAEHRFWLAGKRATGATVLLGVVVNAHLVAVVFRSHLNAEVFRRHRVRFVLVPLAVFAAMMLSMWAVVLVAVLVVFWDVYHSALQTFGLARIYDRNAGNDPHVGRRLDLGLNLLLYAGPILAGASMLAHFGKFEVFDDVDATFFTQIPAFMAGNQRYLAWAVVLGGTLYAAGYVVAYARLRARGYRISSPKVFLLASTGLCSIWVWGFNPWGQAFFIMNIFHAVQYLALVWWSENASLRRGLRLSRARLGKPVALALFLGSALAYGGWTELVRDDDRLRWSLVQVVALMHFFYDGFIWSVRRKQV
jgi:hypothetical protein